MNTQNHKQHFLPVLTARISSAATWQIGIYTVANVNRKMNRNQILSLSNGVAQDCTHEVEMKHLWIILLLFVVGCKEPVVINVYQMDVNEVAELIVQKMMDTSIETVVYGEPIDYNEVKNYVNDFIERQ